MRAYRAVTLKDVAAEAGVSLITASRALRTPEVVSAKTRERVAMAINLLGYAPNQAARALASARSAIIGIIVPSVSNLVFTDVLRGVYDAIEGTDLQVQLGNSRYTARKEEELLRVFAAQRPTGLIVAGRDQTPEVRAILSQFGCPIVQVMDLDAEPVDMSIGFDHTGGGRVATQHLLDRGYRRIGFLGARMDARARRRLNGYTKVLEQAGLADPKLVMTTPQPSSVALGGRMLTEFLSAVPDADAVFCNNDDIAMGALFECQRRGIKVPEQFGIMGFNDLEYADAIAPSLSTIRTHRYQMGRRAIEMIVAANSGERPEPATVDLGFELMARQSTARA
ncbi:LacI family DNA-binding transcriptional regulator [Devosia submarina]|uniref:LacI family DNA-binding transcriptional regulator n=1 Tax=Devosia submarina TaxID=1173082 RepID=UPI000D332214|nr:LacI family DNA-binding transcriptional regulator [Devosia submarina]